MKYRLGFPPYPLILDPRIQQTVGHKYPNVTESSKNQNFNLLYFNNYLYDICFVLGILSSIGNNLKYTRGHAYVMVSMVVGNWCPRTDPPADIEGQV